LEVLNDRVFPSEFFENYCFLCQTYLIIPRIIIWLFLWRLRFAFPFGRLAFLFIPIFFLVTHKLIG